MQTRNKGEITYNDMSSGKLVWRAIHKRTGFLWCCSAIRGMQESSSRRERVLCPTQHSNRELHKQSPWRQMLKPVFQIIFCVSQDREVIEHLVRASQHHTNCIDANQKEVDSHSSHNEEPRRPESTRAAKVTACSSHALELRIDASQEAWHLAHCQ